MTRVVLAGGGTGGHLMPALALAEALARMRPDVEPVLVGAIRGVEAGILPKRPFRYHLLPVEPIHRRAWWRNARWPLLLPDLRRACRRVLDQERPHLVVGTGGYAAGPLLWAAHRRRIPLALQEQNAQPGLTTRWLARWAAQVHLGFPEARDRLRLGSTTAVYALGNPIVPPGGHTRVDARRALGLDGKRPVVLVMGGSQGARAINRALAGALASGELGDVAVLWSVGRASYGEYADLDRAPDVHVRAFWDPIGEAYAAADLVVARAGAMTLAEIAAWGLPSVLIPLPTAAADHQTANARALETAGAAVHLPETALTSGSLAETALALLADRARLAEMGRAARDRGHPEAAEAIVKRLLELHDASH
jgi:UDP-N-acetylglucosamine--N-acetylmuramyl-(pentapeptide) pyrophosphoryl-undecaprenol N-acetylglucosamine transferase